jgi:twitching motility protein PilU
MDLDRYFVMMAEKKASDLFLSAGAPPAFKIDGITSYVDQRKMSREQTAALAYTLMNERQQKEFEATLEMNLAVRREGVGRFRVNVYKQRGDVSVVIRYITDKIPSISELNLPRILEDLVMIPRGLVLIVGATGSGKTTTLASMVDYRNQNKSGHILAIEDPIEYLHGHKQSIVDQREVGLDTMSYGNALKNAMREAPDVIVIGEIRDRETMQHAIAYAETGHLCLSTLHANNANQALDRVINFFPETAKQQLLMDLSFNLKAVISQRLLVGTDTKRIPAVELLLHTSYVSDLILKGELDALKEAMKQGAERGMMTFDDSLYRLYAEGRISRAEAMRNADSQTDLALRIRLSAPIAEDEGDDLELARDEDEARTGVRMRQVYPGGGPVHKPEDRHPSAGTDGDR